MSDLLYFNYDTEKEFKIYPSTFRKSTLIVSRVCYSCEKEKLITWYVNGNGYAAPGMYGDHGYEFCDHCKQHLYKN